MEPYIRSEMLLDGKTVQTNIGIIIVVIMVRLCSDTMSGYRTSIIVKVR